MKSFCSKYSSEDHCGIGNEGRFDGEIAIFGFRLFLDLNCLDVIDVTCAKQFFVSWSISSIIEGHNCPM